MQVRTRRYSPRHSRAFMSSVPPGLSPLQLPLGEIVFYPTGTGRPGIRSLTREIAALGYKVLGFPLRNTNLRLLLAPEVPTAPPLSDSSSDQSAYESPNTSPTRTTSIRTFQRMATGAPSAPPCASSRGKKIMSNLFNRFSWGGSGGGGGGGAGRGGHPPRRPLGLGAPRPNISYEDEQDYDTADNGRDHYPPTGRPASRRGLSPGLGGWGGAKYAPAPPGGRGTMSLARGTAGPSDLMAQDSGGPNQA